MVNPMTRFSRHFPLWLAGICILGFQSKTAAENKVVRPTKYATEYNWSVTPSEDLSQPGNRIVSLPSCPPGVTGQESEYWVLIRGPENGDSEISGSVTGGSLASRSRISEPVKVTGGTCAGGGRPGTLQFTLVKPHAPGYSISSASGGLQEALIAARYAPTNPAGASQSGTVIVPPGEYKAFARVSIRASGITVDFSGSIVECWMDDACIFVGDPKSSTAFQDVTLISPGVRL